MPHIIHSRIIAIDPGYDRLGVAVLEKKSGKEVLLYSNCFKTSKKDSFHIRLLQVGSAVAAVVQEWEVEALAIESLVFNTNQKTALRVAEARGVIAYETAKLGLPFFEYTPLQIKIAVTGYGRGSKSQVKEMVERIIKIQKKIHEDDEYDAIAIGITHLASLHIK